MTLLDRDLHRNDLIDRVERLERDLRRYSDYAFVPGDVLTNPEEPDWESLSGWVVTGSTLQDEDGKIKLDPTVPRIQLASNGYIESSNFVSGSAGFQINGGTAEFNDVTVRGTIYATAGEIGGWTISASSIAKNNATLHSDGYLLLGTSNDIVRMDAVDATYRLWVGNATAASAPFRVSKIGAVTATSGTIGGWSLTDSQLYSNNVRLYASGSIVAGTGTDVATMNAAHATYRLYVGNNVAGSAPFRVSKAGEVWATNGHFTGEIDANSGHLGDLDVDGLITVGTGTPYIEIDGPNKRIETSNFVSGMTGFRIDGVGNAEFLNIEARGCIRSAVFEVDQVVARVGQQWLTKSAGTLDADATATGTTFSITVKSPLSGAAYLFAVGDIVFIKDEFNITWGHIDSQDGVDATDQHYTVDYDYGSSSATYRAGLAVVDVGVSGDGMLVMDARGGAGADEQFYDVRTHAGAPWTTQTLKMRLGDLSGVSDPDLSPTGYGLYSDNVFLNGDLVAASGEVIIDSSGIHLKATTAPWAETNAINFMSGANVIGFLYGYHDTTLNDDGLYMRVDGLTGQDALVTIRAQCVANEHSNVKIQAKDTAAWVRSYIEVFADDATSNGSITLWTDDVIMDVAHVAVGTSAIDTNHVLYVLDNTASKYAAHIKQLNATGHGLLINNNSSGIAFEVRSDADVEHGMTTYVDTHTYLSVGKLDNSAGGAMFRGWKDADGSAGYALSLQGFLGEAADDGKTSSSVGVCDIMAAVKSGTGAAAVGADGNLLIVRNYGTTRFIFDAEGSAHAEVEWVAFDEHDDVALLESLEHHVIANGDSIKDEFGGFLEYNKAAIEEMKLAHFEDDRPGHAMVNFTRLSMLLTGSVRQLNDRQGCHERALTDAVQQLNTRLERYERALVGLGVDVKMLEAGELN